MNKVGIGTRALNFIVDTVLISLLAFAFFRTWNWYVVYWNYPFYNFGWFFFGTLFLYYTLFELITARTPGKWFSYSKVVDEKGKRPGFLQVLLRSIIRVTIIDMFFLPFLDKTLHDHLSKTDVVEV